MGEEQIEALKKLAVILISIYELKAQEAHHTHDDVPANDQPPLRVVNAHPYTVRITSIPVPVTPIIPQRQDIHIIPNDKIH